MAKLIEKTIYEGRSIGSLHFTLQALHGRREVSWLGRELERRISVAGFWKLIVGTGYAGAIVDFLYHASPDFRDQILVSARDLSQEQWEQVLGRGNLFSLSRLISESKLIWDEEAGGKRLLGAMSSRLPGLVASGSWYQRGSAAHTLATFDSLAGHAASEELGKWIQQVPLEQLSFVTLREAVYGISLLYEQRPEARPFLTAGLRDLLPTPRHWKLNPQEDIDLTKLLLQLVSDPEFSAADAEYVSDGLIQRLTPTFVGKCPTEDVLWTLWALFGVAHGRGHIPAAFGQRLPSAFQQSLRDRLATGLSQKNLRDELRSRFALLGLCSLLDISVDWSIVITLSGELERCSKVGAWWLSAGQSFVRAWLVLRGLEMAKPFGVRAKADFLQRLLIAADEYTELDAAAEYLREDVRRQLER